MLAAYFRLLDQDIEIEDIRNVAPIAPANILARYEIGVSSLSGPCWAYVCFVRATQNTPVKLWTSFMNDSLRAEGFCGSLPTMRLCPLTGRV